MCTSWQVHGNITKKIVKPIHVVGMYIIAWQGATDAWREISGQDVIDRAMDHWDSRLPMLLIKSLPVALSVLLVWMRPVGARLVHSYLEKDPMAFLDSRLLSDVEGLSDNWPE